MDNVREVIPQLYRKLEEAQVEIDRLQAALKAARVIVVHIDDDELRIALMKALDP